MSKAQRTSVFSRVSSGNFSIKKRVLFKSRNSPTVSLDNKRTKTRFQQVSLFILVGVMAFTVSSPAYAMDLFNTSNPPEIKRSKVPALDSPFNSTKAQPSQTNNDFLLSNRYNNQDKADSKPVKELENMRTAYTKTYLNSDGTKTLDYTTTQRHYKDAADKNAKWQDIDNTLEQKQAKDKSRYFVGDAGNMSGSMNRLSKGISVDIEDKDITVKPLAAANVEPEQIDERTVAYRNVWPGADLEYELRGESVKEMIIVKDKNAPTTYNFSVTGGKVINHPTRDDELTIAGLPDDYSFSALTLAVNERGVISEKRVSQSPNSAGNGIVVKLDKDWFKSQPDSAFPMRIDPTIQKQSDIQYKMFKSDGYKCSSSNCYANTGSLKDGTWKHWRSYIKFPYSELKNKTVLDAKLYGWYKSGADGTNDPSKIYLGHASCHDDYDCVGSSAGSQADVTTNFNISFTSKLKSLVDADNYSAWWSVRGKQGSSKTFKPYYDMRATVKYDTPTPMTKASSPADKSTVVTTQPTLKVNSITDADGDAMKYYFRVATNPDAQTGAVINSGWISSNEWKVPEFILQDGQTYYWKAYSKGYAETAPTWVRSFKVDMRTGKNSTQAYEDIGPISVDLATGNATTSTGSHSISALGGDIGLTLNYNTPALVESGTAKKTSTKYGLTGYYYNDTSGSKAFPSNAMDPSRLLMVRNDNTIKFDWGTGAPSPGLPSDKFLVRWKGYVSVPESGSYSIGANSDDGVRIKLGTGVFGSDETVLDSWSYIAGDRWGTAKNISAGQQVPITVEYYEDGGPAKMRLLIKGTNTDEQEIPTTWLAPNANILPDGWELAAGNGDASFERIQIQSNAAILSDSTGQKYEYTWTGGSYKAPKDQEAILLRNSDNTYTVIDTDGTTYVFDAEGKLISLTTPEDDRQPSALKYEYAGNPSRLVKIYDGTNSARNGTLHYSGDNECDVMSGFDNAPTGYLCAFTTTDDKKTTFQYEDDNLARIVQPGDDYEDYRYDTLGRINGYRDSVANDAIAYGIRSSDASVITEINYNTSGKVVGIKAPAPIDGATRQEETIEYLAGATTFHATDVPEPHNFSRKVTYDDTFRTLSDTNALNLTTSLQWHDTKDLVLSITDSTGLKSTTIYNEDDMPVHSYGPAPSAWFDSSNKPIASRVNDVPHAQTGYDEGITGLGVVYYDNKKLLRAPKLNSTVTWGTGEMVKTSFANGDAPVAPTDGWSARYTGKIKLGAAGNYTFKLKGDAGFRLFINDIPVIDGWGDGSLNGGDRTLTSTAISNTTADTSYPIRIEQYHGATGATNLQLFMSGPGQPETSVLSNLLSPDYGLTTSAKIFDSEQGDLVSKISYSKPEYGLASGTVLDPDGINLEASAEYEAPGDGFLRQTKKVLPGGGETQYLHYSATDARDNPCTPETESIIQAGFVKGRIEQDPDGSGGASSLTTETIYDESGQAVATRNNDDPWSCSTFDERGRPLTTSIPGYEGKIGHTITNNYLVDSSPLKASTSDSSGTIISEVDLLGQLVAYTDAMDNITTYTYDSFGQLESKTSPIGTETYEYDQYGRLATHKLDGDTYATVSYDQYGRLESVDYPSDLSLEGFERDDLGRASKVTYKADSVTLSDEITLSTSGNVMSGTENGISKSYSYDSAGRLVGATIGSDIFGYEFGAQDPSCSVVAGNNPNASKSGNRTKYTLNGQSTTYCYDMADRLRTSSDARFTDVEYDSHGNITSLGDTTHRTIFEYDSNDRNTYIKETYSNEADKSIKYERDVSDRLLRRTYKIDNSVKSDAFYGYTADSDSPSFVSNGAGVVVQKYLTLPGGVTATINPQSTSSDSTIYSLSNMHGDTMATVDSNGVPTAQMPTGPFGEILSSSGVPKNTVDGASFTYVGGFKKTTDSDLAIAPTQMGARVYIAELGRFLSVDPTEGGTDNNYAYVNDPVNSYDLDGNWGFASVFNAIKNTVKSVVKAVKKVVVSTVKKVVKAAVKVVTKVQYVYAKIVKPAVRAVAKTVSKSVTTKARAVKKKVKSVAKAVSKPIAKFGNPASLGLAVVSIGVCAATAGIGCGVLAGAAIVASAITAAAQSYNKHESLRRAAVQGVAAGALDWGAGKVLKRIGGALGAGNSGVAAAQMNGLPFVFGGGIGLSAGIDKACDSAKIC